VTLLLIGNEPLAYDWGSEELIQDFANLGVLGQPAAEVWFGSHPKAPSVIASSSQTLRDLVPELGFLVKLLAAKKPLSIQAHPSKERAQEQFALANPSYTDANHKPEMIIAITSFEALCGFRPLQDIETDLAALANSDAKFEPWLKALTTGGLKAATEFALTHNLAEDLGRNLSVLKRSRVQLYQKLAEYFQGDVGLAIGTILMNHVSLAPGEGLYLPAGNIHAYLSGLGLEVMASSDNVLRGGLTKKPIDVPELMQVLDFQPLEDPIIKPKTILRGLTQYPADVEDFTVYRVEPSASNMLIDLKLEGSMIVVCTEGELEISTSQDEYLKIKRGSAAFVSDARLFSIMGTGAGYLAMG
jgi:mannose-6-phosphate isomerase